MAIKLSVTARNGRLDSLESSIGQDPILRIWDATAGSIPANCAAADDVLNVKLVEMTLPQNWMEDADAGSKIKAGTWQDLEADAAGEAQYFRVYNSLGTVCHLQGTCSMPAGGGDMILDNVNIAVNQKVTVVTFTLTDGNA